MTISCEHSVHVFDSNFLMTAVSRSSLELITYLYETNDKLVPLNQLHHPSGKTALHLAVSRANYELVAYLLFEHGFEELVNSKHKTMNDLIHICIENTTDISDPEIEQRLQIIRLLHTSNSELVNMKSETGPQHGPVIPLLCHRIHVNCLVELIDLGGNILAQNLIGETFLHLDTNYLLSNNFTKLLNRIPDDKLKMLLNMRDNNGSTILHLLLDRMNPEMEALMLLLSSGASVHSIAEGCKSLIKWTTT